MSAPTYSFGPFVLDAADRRLLRDGEPVEVSGRYFDALILLAAESGRLVTKDRFMDEVWRGIPVTDEALTQCIRSLRRALDDDAAAPRYIETVPRHGYRFIAEVSGRESAIAPARRPPGRTLAPVLQDAAAAALGGGCAGIVAALLYVSAGLVTPTMGAASTLLVLVSINLLLGLVAGGAVGLGMGAMRAAGEDAWRMALGGALGGLLVGALGHTIGNDLIELLFGNSPGAITGAGEGCIVGLAAAAGFLGAIRAPRNKLLTRYAAGFAAGAVGGALIALAGGRLMVGSLAELAHRFPNTRLGLDRSGTLLEVAGNSRLGIGVATTLEAALFAGGVTGALLLLRRLRASNN